MSVDLENKQTPGLPASDNHLMGHSFAMPELHHQSSRYRAANIPFAGRLGGNQEFVLDRDDPENAVVLEKVPDAAPYMTIKQSFDFQGFRETEIWKAALMEGMGTLMLVYMTTWVNLSPATPTPLPTTPARIFATAAFLGPLVGAVINITLISLFIFCFAGVSGGHLNPLITIATFFARLTSLPRLTLYVVFQTIGAALAGLLVRASYASRDFKVGGCFLLPDAGEMSVGSAFTVEFVADVTLLFLAFGVGLDPRQRAVLGPALAPIFVGVAVGTITLSTAFTRPGYGGAAVNPARCFGVFVGSHFPHWHWIHWVGPVAASIVHGVFYCLIPPWENSPPPLPTPKRGSSDGPRSA